MADKEYLSDSQVLETPNASPKRRSKDQHPSAAAPAADGVDPFQVNLDDDPIDGLDVDLELDLGPESPRNRRVSPRHDAPRGEAPAATDAAHMVPPPQRAPPAVAADLPIPVKPLFASAPPTAHQDLPPTRPESMDTPARTPPTMASPPPPPTHPNSRSPAPASAPPPATHTDRRRRHSTHDTDADTQQLSPRGYLGPRSVRSASPPREERAEQRLRSQSSEVWQQSSRWGAATMPADLRSRALSGSRGQSDDEQCTGRPQLATTSYFRQNKLNREGAIHERLYAVRRTEPRQDQISLTQHHTFSPHLVTSDFMKGRQQQKESSPFFTRLYGDHAKNADRLKEGKERKEKMEMEGCTFKPSISKTPASAKPTEGQSWVRLHQKAKEIDEKREARKKALEEQAMAHCTFKPTLVRGGSPTKQHEGGGEEEKAGGQIHDRLYKEAAERRQRVDERSNSIPPGCTFQPALMCKDKTPYQSKGQDRAVELWRAGHEKVTELRLQEEAKKPPRKPHNDDEIECTFFPTTNWARRRSRVLLDIDAEEEDMLLLEDT